MTENWGSNWDLRNQINRVISDEVVLHRKVIQCARSVLGSDVHLTCCYPAYFFQYDRIISSNVKSIGSQATTLPFGNESSHHVPDSCLESVGKWRAGIAVSWCHIILDLFGICICVIFALH